MSYRGAEMLNGFKVGVLLQWLIVFLLSPTCRASSLGLTVHVLPLDNDGGKTVRAHFSVISPSPCPDFSAVCAAGEDCQVHRTPLPFSYTEPSPAWCVRQWQKTVPSDYSNVYRLGPKADFYVAFKANPVIRANNGKLNRPAFVALPPPLRANVNCPVDFRISAKDLDGDKVQCRFAREEKGECRDCAPHSFMELDEGSCTLKFNGNAAAGQYFIYLMAEDLIPSPPTRHNLNKSPLSSVPVHLSLTVEGSASGCRDRPVPLEGTPERDSVQFVLPFQEMKFNAYYKSDLESVSEIAVIGPPDLYRVGFTSIGNQAGLNMAWIRSENNLTQLLPVCFVANSNSFQSELRCLWLYQREMKTLPEGTELSCNQTGMSLRLPVTSLTGVELDELQLNSPTCPVTYNSTHLTAHIPLSGCGTKAVHSGSELVYTNTLRTVHHNMISRRPSLILPLACRIPGVQVNGPRYAINMPTERETFGDFRVWLEFHLPGQGPLARFTSTPRFRSNSALVARARRDASSGNSTSNSSAQAGLQVGEMVKQLDLYVMSNCSVARAEMMVTNCRWSETVDFAVSQPILEKGCMMSSSSLEVVTDKSNSKIYRLDLTTMEVSGTKLYIECQVNFCIATRASDKCPDLCGNISSSSNSNMLINSVFTGTYSIRSGSVSLLLVDFMNRTDSTTIKPSQTVTDPPPPDAPAPNIAIITTTTTSEAPKVTTFTVTSVILMTIVTFLQMKILH